MYTGTIPSKTLRETVLFLSGWRQRGIAYEVGIARFRETARGQIMGLREGMLKMLFSIETQKLLGVHIIGEGATELVHIGRAVISPGAGWIISCKPFSTTRRWPRPIKSPHSTLITA